MFYRRFGPASALEVERQNGVSQREYVVESPQFCPGASGASRHVGVSLSGGSCDGGIGGAGDIGDGIPGQLAVPRAVLSMQALGVDRQIGYLARVRRHLV